MFENHVDLTVLRTLRDVMEAEYPALLDVFIKDSEARVIALNRLIQPPDFSTGSTPQLQQLGLLAHSFKGSSSNMGAARLAGLCNQLEELARGPGAVSETQVRELVLALESEFRVVRDVFDVELQALLTRH